MNVLFLSAWYPYPANNGSKLRIFNLLKGLSQSHQVHLVSFTDDPCPSEAELLEFCASVKAIPWKVGQLTGVRRRLAPFASTPQSFLDTFSQEMVDAINLILDDQEIDLIIASQIKTASYSNHFRGLPAIFEEAELGVMYEQYAAAENYKNKMRYGLTWIKHKRFIEDLLDNFLSVTVASAEEKQLFHAKISQSDVKLQIVPNGVDVNRYISYHEQSKANQLIYTGSFGFDANYEAMVWFIGKVLPLIQTQLPDVQLIITGDHKNLPLPSLSGVTLTGFVDDIRPLIAQSAVSLAPLQTGGGTRLKILEAMALKTPVVATSKGAQGLNAEPNRDIIIEDTPKAFAQAVVRLLEDKQKASNVADNGFNLVSNKYDWNAIVPLLENSISCLVN